MDLCRLYRDVPLDNQVYPLFRCRDPGPCASGISVVFLFLHRCWLWFHIRACFIKHIHTSSIHPYIHAYVSTSGHTYVHTYIPTFFRSFIHSFIHSLIHSYTGAYLCTYEHTITVGDIALCCVELHGLA